MDDDKPTDQPEQQPAVELASQELSIEQPEEIIDAVHEDDIWADPRFEAFNDPVFSPAPMKK